MAEDYHLEIVKETDRAILVSDGDTKAWLPKSQIETTEQIVVGKTMTITVPDWLAEEAGLA